VEPCQVRKLFLRQASFQSLRAQAMREARTRRHPRLPSLLHGNEGAFAPTMSLQTLSSILAYTEARDYCGAPELNIGAPMA
jgi:hypothetical protein